MDGLPKQEGMCQRFYVSVEKLGSPVRPSSPSPHSCNLVAPTAASLGGERPTLSIPGQPSTLCE